MNDQIHKGTPKTLDPEVYAQLKEALAPAYERLLTLENPIVDAWYRRHFGAASIRRDHRASLTGVSASD